MRKYNIIYADPCWQYNDRRLIRKDGKKPKFGIGAVNHYETMSTQEICRMPVRKIAADNAALFLWVTMPRLPAGLKVMSSWGFEYKTNAFTWIKTNKNGSPFFGIGYYTRSNAEICILGLKGKLKPVSHSVHSVIMEPKREHSRKPDTARDRIVELFGDLPRVELFARSKHKGWDTHGNEKGKFNEN